MVEAQAGREEVRECAELGARKGTSSAEEGPGQTDCRGQNWKQETRTWKLQYNTIQYNTIRDLLGTRTTVAAEQVVKSSVTTDIFGKKYIPKGIWMWVVRRS